MTDTLDDILRTLPDEPTTGGRELLPGGMLSEGFECATEAIQDEVEHFT